MKRNRRRVLWSALLVALLVMTALIFAASHRVRRFKTEETRINSLQTRGNRARVRRAYVQRNGLSPKLIWHLKALGDRLEKPGRERLSVTGTLTRGTESQTEEISAVLEFPERLQLTAQKGNQRRIIMFDGEHVNAVGNPLETAEQDLIETLVYGSPEHFFNTQMEGRATRYLGSRFRLDDGSSRDYDGPYYDVYKVSESASIGSDQPERLKIYYFNSETLLLDRVIYEIDRNGSTVKVEVRLSGWTKEQGQHVARRIERLENGASIFVLAVRTAGLSARANDGVFAD